MSRIASASVTSTSPLKITMFGDTVAISAVVLAPYVPAANDRVRVQVRRSGLLPIVQGKLP